VQLAAVWSIFAAESGQEGAAFSATAEKIAGESGIPRAVGEVLLGLLVGRGFVRAANVGGEVFYRMRV